MSAEPTTIMLVIEVAELAEARDGLSG